MTCSERTVPRRHYHIMCLDLNRHRSREPYEVDRVHKELREPYSGVMIRRHFFSWLSQLFKHIDRKSVV